MNHRIDSTSIAQLGTGKYKKDLDTDNLDLQNKCLRPLSELEAKSLLDCFHNITKMTVGDFLRHFTPNPQVGVVINGLTKQHTVNIIKT